MLVTYLCTLFFGVSNRLHSKLTWKCLFSIASQHIMCSFAALKILNELNII